MVNSISIILLLLSREGNTKQHMANIRAVNFEESNSYIQVMVLLVGHNIRICRWVVVAS